MFTKQESSANVIYQVIGKDTVELTLRFDFKGKVQGSLVENPHDLKGAFGSDLMPPSGGWGESATTSYERSSIQDGVLYSSNTTVANERRQLRFGWNVLEGMTRLLGEKFFSSQGLLSVSQKVNFIRTAITELSSNVFGFGASSTGNKLTLATWRSNYSAQDWLYNAATTANSVVNIKSKVPGASVYAYIDDNGNVYNIVYADPSDGVKPSTVNIDFAYLDIKISISMNEFIRSMIAANHIENIATEEEAEAGENNEKTMTPLRVFQAIAKWTKDKFVSRTENETVLGVKNFANGLQVGGNNVLTQNGEIRFVTNSTNNSSLESGSIVFKRYGDDVDIYANFQVRASGDLTRDMNIVAESIVDDIFEPGENFSFFVGNETAQAVVKFVGKGIKAHSTLTKGIWYVGTASYKAKNKL